GGAARREPPLGDADLGGIDLNFGFGGEHGTSRRDQGTNTRNTKIANTTMWTSPNRILVRPVPKVSMLRTKVRNNSTMFCSERPSTSCLSSAQAAIATAGTVSPMVASEDPSARLMLFCRSFLRAAPMADTLSGSRIRSATTTPAKAGGAPMAAVAASTTSENFLASSTTA